MASYQDIDASGLLLPDGRIMKPRLVLDEHGIQRVPGLMTRNEWRQLQAVLRAQFFLFRNDGGDVGERMKCETKNPDGSMRGCGNYHPYVSYMCVERPFKGGSGLEQGLFTVFRASKDPIRRQQLMSAINILPDLARGHPFSANQWAPRDGGENWLAALVSIPYPISKEDARKFAVRINTEKKPPVFFCLQETCTNYLEDDLDCPSNHRYL